MLENKAEIVIYQTPDSQTNLKVRFEGGRKVFRHLDHYNLDII